MTEPTYEIKATVLDQADKSDPLNALIVIGVKVQETTAIGRHVVWKDADGRIIEDPQNHTGDTVRVCQVRDDGKEDLAWGCRIAVERDRSPAYRSPLEVALAALALRLLTDPPPEDVLAAIRAATIKTAGPPAVWTGWTDLRQWSEAKDEPVI
jgi:hypothetical protein